jgi:hypothetical protein
MTMKDMTPQEALTQALFLAITAPTDADSQRAVELAQDLIGGFSLSELEVAAAKREAAARAGTGG